MGPYHHVLDCAPIYDLRVADVGDVPFSSRYDLASSHREIEAWVGAIVAAGARPLSVGGDHSISYPILRAVGRDRPVGLVHIDAHSDTGGPFDGLRENHGAPFRNAVLDGVLDPTRTIQIGLRGSSEYLYEFATDSGMTCIHAEEVAELGRAGGGRPGARGGGRGAGLSLLRHRRARPGLRAGHRHARRSAG